MVRILIVLLIFKIVGYIEVNRIKIGGKGMGKSERLKYMREEDKRKEFLKIMGEKARIRDFEKEHIDFMIKKMKRIPIYEMRQKEIKDMEEIKKEIKKGYKEYKIIYEGELGGREIIIIGEPYKYKSSVKWGVIYDVTGGEVIKIGEFNNKGQFFYAGKDKLENPYPEEEVFYVVMFQKNMSFRDILAIDKTDISRFIKFHPEYKDDLNIKMDVIIIDKYYYSLVYGMGDVWWYNRRSKKWKWLIIDTWF